MCLVFRLAGINLDPTKGAFRGTDGPEKYTEAVDTEQMGTLRLDSVLVSGRKELGGKREVSAIGHQGGWRKVEIKALEA